MRALFSFFALCAAFVNSPVVSAQDSPGQFFNPTAAGENRDFSGNALWQIGETQTIKFTTTYSSYTIHLWQQNLYQGSGEQGPTIYQISSGGLTQFDWTVQTYQFDLATSNVFFLWLNPVDEDSSDWFTSHYFNITASVVSSSSSVSSSTSLSSTATASSTSTSTAAATSTAASSSTVSATPSPTAFQTAGTLSTGAQAGIGVGAGLAGLIALAVGIMLWRRRKSGNRGASQVAAEPGGYDQPEMMRGPHEERHFKSPPPAYPVELDADGGAGEPLYHTSGGPVELR